MKRTLQKSLALFLAVLMLVLCAPAAFAINNSGTDGDIKWTVSGSKLIIERVNGTSGAMKDYLGFGAPWLEAARTVTNITISAGVTKIGSNAFINLVYVSQVTIPDTVKTIEESAFYSCDSLGSITIPSGVTTISKNTFKFCAGLQTVTLPLGLTEIGEAAFLDCNEKLTVNYPGGPDDWNKIKFGEDAFAVYENGDPRARTEEEAVTINYYYGVEGAENAINAIGENDGSDAYLARIAVAAAVFMHLTDDEKDMVTNVDVLHAARRTVPDYDFSVDCGDLVGSAINWLTQEVIIGGFGPMRNDAARKSYFENNPIAVKTLAVTEGVTGVATRMFKGCDQLESVTLPMSMKTIDQRAFAGCRHLNTINYPGGPADWNKIIIAADAFDSAPVSEPTCYYYGVEGAMNAIDDIGDVEYTDECKARIDEARKAYDRLSDYETTLVTNYAALTKAEEDYAALETAALLAAAKTAAKEELAAYKNADDYRDAQRTELAKAIAAGEVAIDAATNSDAVDAALEGAKTAIDAIKTDAELTAEEEAAAAAADQAAADAVEAKIAAIGSVEYTDACKAKIDDAQAAFDALTDTQKALVENKDVLDAAAKKYAELKAEAEKPTEPIEPTDGDVCPICGKTEHDNHRDQVLHAVFVFVHDLVIYVLIPLIKYLSE